MITKLLSFANNAIDFIQKFIWIITIVFGITSIASFKSCQNQKQDKQDFITIAKDTKKEIQTISGNFAIEKKQWFVDRKQLRQEYTREQSKSNGYLSELEKLKDYTKDLEIENKRLKSYNNTEIESSDSIETKIVFINCDEVKIEPIKQKHIEITFDQSGEYLDIFYKYNAEIATIVYRDKDKDQFFLWRWFFPDWVYNSVTTINDPNATIENNVNIDFDK